MGKPVEIRYASGLRDTAGNDALAATYIGQRLIVLHKDLRSRKDEHARVLAHELFHFAWVRLGNPARREWEEILVCEWERGALGDAGWSAEWRKKLLHRVDVSGRTRLWREYCCEAFCDTGAWLWTGVEAENTLQKLYRARRSKWFARLGRLRV